MKDCLYYYDLPGLALSLRMGDFDYKETCGYTDSVNETALSKSAVFHMASVSKIFTGTAIMMLAREGRLALDDKLCEVLPWLEICDANYPDVTLRHMLTHTSGMNDVYDYHWDKPKTGEDALRNYVMSDEVRSQKFLHSPCEGKFSYSNIAYEILGAVIADKSGMSFEEYIEEKIFGPLGMDNSSFLTFERDERELARPHQKDEGKHIVLCSHYPYNREHGPSSTLTTDIYDIEKFANAHISGMQIDYDEIWREYAGVPNNGERMGLSWFMRKQRGRQMYGHEGTDDGFRASFWICPKEDMYVAVMSNISKAPVKKISKGVADILFKEQ